LLHYDKIYAAFHPTFSKGSDMRLMFKLDSGETITADGLGVLRRELVRARLPRKTCDQRTAGKPVCGECGSDQLEELPNGQTRCEGCKEVTHYPL
jgi:hypothetical protein